MPKYYEICCKTWYTIPKTKQLYIEHIIGGLNSFGWLELFWQQFFGNWNHIESKFLYLKYDL